VSTLNAAAPAKNLRIFHLPNIIGERMSIYGLGSSEPLTRTMSDDGAAKVVALRERMAAAKVEKQV
jgi:hypothetical protein